MLNISANYDLRDLGKQNSYYITNTLRKISQGIDDFKHLHKNNQFSNIICSSL